MSREEHDDADRNYPAPTKQRDIRRVHMAQYHVRICTNISCMLRGGDDLFEKVCKHYGVQPKQPSADGKILVEEIACMGACDSAPVVSVNDDFYEHVTVADLPELFEILK